jgi:hypothetical protein
VNARPAVVFALALAVLLPRIAGLHFHVEAPQAAVHAHSLQLPAASAIGALGGPQDVHLWEHQAGAVDADAVAMSNMAAKALSSLQLVLFIGFAVLLQLGGLRTLLVTQPPLRPPRLRRPFEIFPPSQGPPHAA